MHHPGRFVWLELESRRLIAAERFYVALLGWDRGRLHLPGWGLVPVFANGDHRVGTATLCRAPFSGTRWGAFVSGDPDRVCVRAAACQGAIVSPPEDTPGWCRLAEVSDPGGHPLSVLRLEGGDPPEVRPGDLAIMQLWAPDATALVAFYAGVLDLEPVATAAGVLMLAHGRPRLCLDDAPGGPAAPWVPWFASVGLDADVARAEQLGALRVRDDALGPFGRRVLLEDPTGGAFGLVDTSGA